MLKTKANSEAVFIRLINAFDQKTVEKLISHYCHIEMHVIYYSLGRDLVDKLGQHEEECM